MRLGTETGSVMNHIMSRQTIGQPLPFVGMGATQLLWSDRHACTVSQVQTVRGKTIVSVRNDHSWVVAGSAHDGSAEYEFQPNPDASETHFRQRDDGSWEQVIISNRTGRWGKASTSRGLRLGERDEYRDPSF